MASELVLECAECRAVSDKDARGWAGYRCDDAEIDEEPTLAFYCPACGLAAFGGRPRMRRGGNQSQA